MDCAFGVGLKSHYQTQVLAPCYRLDFLAYSIWHWNPSPCPAIKPLPPAVEVLILKHWTARAVPAIFLKLCVFDLGL